MEDKEFKVELKKHYDNIEDIIDGINKIRTDQSVELDNPKSRGSLRNEKLTNAIKALEDAKTSLANVDSDSETGEHSRRS